MKAKENVITMYKVKVDLHNSVEKTHGNAFLQIWANFGAQVLNGQMGPFVDDM